MRTVKVMADGAFVVSNDPDGVLANFLAMATHGVWAKEAATAFTPDGYGVWIDTLGGATRMGSDSIVPPPYDQDPAIAPDRDELWLVVRERRAEPPQRVILTGDELRYLVARASSLWSSR
jgi:hypothetical protein